MAEEVGFRVRGVPEISSDSEYRHLEPGMRFISNGRVYIKGRNQRDIPPKGAPDWGAQEEIINMMLLGYGDEVLGALDWLAAAIVPDDFSLTGRDRPPDPTLAEAQERLRQGQRLYRETNPLGATLSQLAGGLTPAGAGLKVSQLVGRAFPSLSRYWRGIVGGTIQGGIVGSGEADPGERGERAVTGAKTGAIVSATVPAVAALGGFLVRTISGRLNPQGTARNIVNSALLQANVSRTEAATEEELALLPSELQGLPPHLRRTARRLGQLGPDATIADAAPGTGVRAVGRLATRLAGGARERAQGLLSGRALSEGSRIIEALDSILSSGYGNAESIGRSLIVSATPAYDNAFGLTRDDEGKIDRNIPNTTPGNQSFMSLGIARVLGTPNGRKAFKAAVEQMENEFGWDYRMGRQLDEVLSQLTYAAKRNNLGEIISIPDNAPGLPLEFLDKVKVQLQQMGVELEGKDRRARDARIVWGQAKDLIRELDDLDQSDGMYAVARETAESKFKLYAAYDEGLVALGPKGSVNNIKKIIQAYTEGERAMFRAGAAAYLRDKILKVPESGRATRAVFGNTLIMDKLAALMDDEADFAALRKVIVQEKTYALTQRQILSGGAGEIVSPQQGRESLGTFAALLGSKLPGANPLIVAGFFRRLAQRLMGAASNEEIARIILTRNPEENRILLGALANLPTDPEAGRLRDIVARALAQQVEVKRDRYQVPTEGGEYRLQDFERSMLSPQYYGRGLSKVLEANLEGFLGNNYDYGSALSRALNAFTGVEPKGD